MNPKATISGNEPGALASVADDVALWWCPLDAAPADEAALSAALSPAERERAARFGTDALRLRWIAGRNALRSILGRVLGLPPAGVPIVRGIRGRPELREAGAAIDFNVSHTGHVALIGVLRTRGRAIRIGVDVEREDRVVGVDRLARRVLAPGEQAAIAVLTPDERRRRFLRYWTCKEAMSKATGDGLIAPFRAIHVEPGPPPRVVAGVRAYAPPAWTLHAAPVPDGHLATVALWNAAGASD